MSLCVNFSYAMYLRYFPMKSKVWLRGNFSPPNHRLELWRWTGFPTSSTLCPRCVHVVSTFGLVAGLLRNKKIPDELINSAGFMAIVNLVNSATLDFESEGAKNLSFGAKTSQDSEELVSLLAERSARINSLEVEVKELQARISHLESSTEASLDDSSLLNSPCCSSTPSSSSSSSCSSIDDTKNRPDLGTINKKRQRITLDILGEGSNAIHPASHLTSNATWRSL